MRKKSLEGYICHSEKIKDVLIVDTGFIAINENFAPATNLKELPNEDGKGYKKVRITIEEIK